MFSSAAPTIAGSPFEDFFRRRGFVHLYAKKQYRTIKWRNVAGISPRAFMRERAEGILNCISPIQRNTDLGLTGSNAVGNTQVPKGALRLSRVKKSTNTP